MDRIAKGVVGHRKLIIIIAIILLIPSLFANAKVGINYDVLSYLPDNIQTVKGQNIMQKDFGTGGISMMMVSGMNDKDTAKLENKVKNVKNVKDVIWYDDIADLTMPKSWIPQKYYKAFNSGDTTMMAVFLKTPMSSNGSIAAVEQIRRITGTQCLLSGTSAFVTDMKNICDKEEPRYVLIAVLLAFIVLATFMDSWITPVLILAGIGVEIMYNLGTNIFMPDVSFITQAIASVLQLGVTMDLSIFLVNSYREQMANYETKEEAMQKAIAKTGSAIFGSALTLMAGFISMCFMTFTLGMNMGIVMTKGVVFGVLGTFTILPSLILLFDKAITKTTHVTFHMRFEKLSHWVTGHRRLIIVLFLLLILPAYYGQSHAQVYYDLQSTLPDSYGCRQASIALSDKFGMSTTHVVMVNKDVSSSDMYAMTNEINDLDGVTSTLGESSLLGPSMPEEFIPSNITSIFKGGDYQMMMINSKYKVASDKCNDQITQINSIVHKYDAKGTVIGEGPLTKDLIKITSKDFKVVSIISILMIFIILLLVLRSWTLPIILVSVIECAVFINLGIPFYTGSSLAFIASICIGTIQLGSCVNYAILMTTRYRDERYEGKDRRTAVEIAHSTSVTSIIMSATGFFAATIGVAIYSDIGIISQMCFLLARGALLSATMVIFVLPALLMVFDKAILKTSRGFVNKERTRDGERLAAQQI